MACDVSKAEKWKTICSVTLNQPGHGMPPCPGSFVSELPKMDACV